ncbi:MAG: hypothetical protein RBS68_08640 [Anaerolineales bacterium]|nr:hypothetical protein [Anaerolineales bacterium]
MHEDRSKNKYWYGPHQDEELRCRRRIQNDLGLNQAAAETVLRLRRQVIELQSQMRQLQAELDAQLANENMRLARYRQVYSEAVWIEFEIQERE